MVLLNKTVDVDTSP